MMTVPRVAGQCKGSWEKERGDGKISGGEGNETNKPRGNYGAETK